MPCDSQEPYDNRSLIRVCVQVFRDKDTRSCVVSDSECCELDDYDQLYITRCRPRHDAGQVRQQIITLRSFSENDSNSVNLYAIVSACGISRGEFVCDDDSVCFSFCCSVVPYGCSDGSKRIVSGTACVRNYDTVSVHYIFVDVRPSQLRAYVKDCRVFHGMILCSKII